MDIFCIETGKVFYEVDETFGALLCEGLSSYFRRAQKRNAAPSFGKPNVAAWSVRELNGTVFIEGVLGAQVWKVNGPPTGAAATFAKQGLQVPEEILDQYAAATNQKV